MKILYSANDRDDAQLAANAVRGLAPDLTVVWAGHLSDAARWVSANRDVAAIVVDIEVQNEGCATLVRHVRTLGLTTPILIVAAETEVLPATVLAAGASEFVLKNESLPSSLATFVSRLLRPETEPRVQALTAENERLRASDSRLQAALAARVRLNDALERQLKEGAHTRQKLDARLAAALTLLQHRDADVETSAARLRTREEELATATEACRALEQRQARLEEALDDLERRSANDRSSAARESVQLKSEFEAALAGQVARRETVERNLAGVREELTRAAALLQDANERHRLEISRASEAEREAARRQAELQSAISVEIAGRHAIEQDLAAVSQRLEASELALRDTAQAYAADLASASAALTDRQAEYEARLAEVADARTAAEQRLLEVDALLERSRFEREADRTAAAERHALIEASLAEANRELAAHESARREDEVRHSAELQAAATAHIALEQRIATLEQQHASSVDAAQAEFAARQDEYEAQLTEQSAAREAVNRQLRDAQETLVRIQRENESVAVAAAERLEQRESELAAAIASRLAVEQRLVEAETAAQDLSRVLDQVCADAAQTIDRLTNEHAAELARFETLVGERDAQLRAQATVESGLRAAMAVHNQQIDELNSQLQTVVQELTATRNHRDALQLEAHRAPELARQLATSRAQNRRQFEHSPIAILRCTVHGALLEANHALTGALGYRTADELRALDFPQAVFESTDDLRWLIERCQNGPRQLADAILKKRDGTRLGMRLHASHVSADAIEIVAEDLTSLRAAEDRLRKAHRMEAVGRLASEVAATCDNLLRDVIRSGDELTASLGGDAPLRQQTEAIVSDVTRAAGFLRQLSAYGDQQARVLSAVDVNKVLRELEPVLKRVAGDDIELVLPKKAAALNVDVDADRVERVLVNVAAYGRARMPSGGRLIVELARVAVDRSFVTKHPNVRQGGHALIRVTEVKAAARMWPFGLRDAIPSSAAADRAVAERPGLDLGAMQTLIADCGGHLWMNAEPGGNMEVKIRLPLRAPVAKAQLTHSGGKRTAVARWFQS